MASNPNLFQRRVPQYFAVYLGICWGIIEFVSFLEARYGLSPHLTDIALLSFGLLTPSVLLFIWNHGRPGKDRWLLIEKIGIPANIAAVVVVLFLVFGDKELGAVTDSIVVEDETGQTIERVVPRASYRKRIALFAFDPATDDTASQWLAFAVPQAVATDLAQNMFLDVRPSAYFRERLRQQGFEGERNVPLSLKQTIAEEQHLPYFVSGRVGQADGQFTADVTLYETARGTVVGERTFTAANVLALGDMIAAAITSDLALPQTAETSDLPVAELLTTSPDAFREYVAAVMAVELRDDWMSAGEHFERAVAADSTFALAWLNLHNVYLLTNRSEASMPPLQKAMDRLYRLPERLHYDIKAEYYFMRRELDKAMAVMRMKVELFPEDIGGYITLSQFQRLVNDRAGVIESYKRILELDPAQHEMLGQIGDLYQELGDFENALRYHTQYAERFPSRPEAILAIADLQALQGDHDAARRSYEKALLTSTANVTAMVGLARLDRDVGRFDDALEQYEQALAAARSAEDRARALGGLAAYYQFRGQLARSLDLRDQELNETAKVSPPVLVAIQQLQRLGTRVHAGQAAAARRILDRVTEQLQPPFDAFSALGQLQLELALENPDAAESVIADFERAIEGSGYQFLRTELFYARGRIAELRGNCEQAITHYEESRAAQPTDASIHHHIGRCLRKLGRLDESIEHHQQTLRVTPYHAGANYELGLTYLEAGDRTKALEHLRRAAETWANADPAYRTASNARAKLRELEGG